MPFAALDLHKKEIEAGVFDDAGQLTLRQRFPATREAITQFAQRHLSRAHKVVVEATFNTWAIVDLLQPLVHSVTVGNPLLTRAIAHAKVKTDKIDVTVLAHLLRLDYLPSVWIPDPATRQLRLQTTERAALTHDRTRLKNRIHSVLHQRLIQAPAELFDAAGLAWLNDLELDPIGRRALDRLLTQLTLTEQQIAAAALTLAHQAHADPRVRLLMTLPGVGFATAQTLLAALGPADRFPSPDHAASYLGLTPATYQSGETTYHGKITKRGSSHARWMLVEAAQHLDSHPGPLGAFFRKLAKKKNRNVAVVATARKLVTIAWHMLKTNQPYRYALSLSTEEKLRHLRVLATGQRRKGGNPKGHGRAVSKLPAGGGSRTIKALPAVYASEGLPALTEFPPGESRMLQQQALTPFAQSLLKTRVVPRRKKTAAP
jgi:transposase